MVEAHSHCSLPSAFDLVPIIAERLGSRRPAFFLDFDGTLAPIASRPELALLPPATHALLASLSKRYFVCVLSGRTLSDLQDKVGLDTAYYGADHGRHILGPKGSGIEHVVGAEARTDLRSAARLLVERIGSIEGVIVEAKDLSLSCHYRLTPECHREAVARAVDDVAAILPTLCAGTGKLVHELRPRDGWHKGRAMQWLLERFVLSPAEVCPICLGDDVTDEDMFAAAADEGIAVLVGPADRPTLARYSLAGPEETPRFLALVDRALGGPPVGSVIEGGPGGVGQS